MTGSLLLPWLSGAAWSQVEACPGALPLLEWREAMTAVDSALATLDGARADRILDDMVYELRCLREVVSPEDVGRMARQVSLVAFYAQDNDELRYWGLLARETVGDGPWPDGLTVPERYFALVADLPAPKTSRSEGGLRVPRGGGALLDGFLVLEPEATVGVQHLFQIADKHGEVLDTVWQTGPAFPEDWTTDAPTQLEVPKWYVAPPERAPLAVPEPEPEPIDAPEPEPESEEPMAEEPVVEAPPVLRFDGDARTAECPWRVDPRVVEASGREIRVNKHVYPLRSAEEQVAFKALLRSCGEFRAVRRFTRWRDARGHWFAGASGYKAEMIEALLTEEPKRRPKGG